MITIWFSRWLDRPKEANKSKTTQLVIADLWPGRHEHKYVSYFMLTASLHRQDGDDDHNKDSAYTLFPMGQAQLSTAINLNNINIY